MYLAKKMEEWIMGCTYDVIEVKIKERKHAEIFAEKFCEILGEDLEWDDNALTIDDFEEEMDYYFLYLDGEPLFSYYDMGNQLQDVVIDFLKEVPEAELEASCNITFNNCGDQLYLWMGCKDGLLKIKQYYADCWFTVCPNCEEDFEEIPCFENKDETPVCPYCEEELDVEVDVDCWEIPFVDGKWEFPEDWNEDEFNDDELE